MNANSTFRTSNSNKINDTTEWMHRNEPFPVNEQSSTSRQSSLYQNNETAVQFQQQVNHLRDIMGQTEAYDNPNQPSTSRVNNPPCERFDANVYPEPSVDQLYTEEIDLNGNFAFVKKEPKQKQKRNVLSSLKVDTKKPTDPEILEFQQV